MNHVFLFMSSTCVCVYKQGLDINMFVQCLFKYFFHLILFVWLGFFSSEQVIHYVFLSVILYITMLPILLLMAI